MDLERAARRPAERLDSLSVLVEQRLERGRRGNLLIASQSIKRSFEGEWNGQGQIAIGVRRPVVMLS